MCSNDQIDIITSSSDVQEVISFMKNNAAAEKEGLTAEHFK